MDDNDRKLAKKIIFRKLNNVNVDHLSSSSLTTTAANNTRNPLEKLAAVCGRVFNSSTMKKPMTLDEEISSYIKAAQGVDNFQQFWTAHSKELPRLSLLVRQTNVIPVTSVASEALFSVASFLQRKQRASLSSRTLRYLLVLKNRHVLEKFQGDY